MWSLGTPLILQSWGNLFPQEIPLKIISYFKFHMAGMVYNSFKYLSVKFMYYINMLYLTFIFEWDRGLEYVSLF